MENKENIKVKNKQAALIMVILLVFTAIFIYGTVIANAATFTTGNAWASRSASNTTKRLFRARLTYGYETDSNTKTTVKIWANKGELYCNGAASADGWTAGLAMFSKKVANNVMNGAITSGKPITVPLIENRTGWFKNLTGKNDSDWTAAGWKTIFSDNKIYTYTKKKGNTNQSLYLYPYSIKGPNGGVFRHFVMNYAATVTIGDYPNRVVSFDANGGSGAPTSVKQYWGDALDLSTLTAPTRTGYNFVGWATSSTATSADVITTLEAQSTSIDAITLYAVWEPKQFTITLDASPGAFSDGSQTKKIVVQYGSDTNNTLSDIPVRPGYTLTGFYEDSFQVYDGQGRYSTVNGYWDSTGCWEQDYVFTSSGPDAPIDTSIIYKAKWTVNTYTITFNKNGGSGGTDSVSVTYDAALPALSSLPTKAGYIFAGYYDAVTGGTQYYDSDGEGVITWNKTENTTLYARWGSADLPVTYNKNTTDSVTNMPESQIAQIGKSFTFSALVPKRSSKWVFKGWCESADGTGTLYSPGQTIRYGETEGMTLYAVWERNAKRHLKIMFSL